MYVIRSMIVTQICNGRRTFVKTSPVYDVIGKITALLDKVVVLPTGYSEFQCSFVLYIISESSLSSLSSKLIGSGDTQTLTAIIEFI